MAVLKLYTNPGNFRAVKVMVAAAYNNVDINVVELDLAKDNSSFVSKSPLGRVPVLETPQGVIFESNAIARYIARIRQDTELYGSSFHDSALVDSWIDFVSHEIELPVILWIYPVFGYLSYNSQVTHKAKDDLATSLQVLEKHLQERTYLVGEKVTLADISCASALLYLFKIVAAPEYRERFPNVLRWFLTIVNQPKFKEVAGEVYLSQEELLPGGKDVPSLTIAKGAGGKKEKAAKEPQKDKPRQEKPKQEKQPKTEKKKEEKPKAAEEDPEEQHAREEKKKAAEHPLKILDRDAPSPFVMDTWKKTYSNASTYDAAMEEFWKTFDAQGYSLWFCEYQYNNELSKLFMTCNLVGGFVQRTDELRKFAFGVMWILGKDEPGQQQIKGAWLMRGQSDQHIKNCNPDAEYYTWTKVQVPVSDADKTKIQEWWCSEAKVDGLDVLDCKVFK